MRKTLRTDIFDDEYQTDVCDGSLADLQDSAPTLFFTLVTGPRRSLSLNLSDTRVYEPQIRALLGTAAHFCDVVVLK